jgi:hypothetical protein
MQLLGKTDVWASGSDVGGEKRLKTVEDLCERQFPALKRGVNESGGDAVRRGSEGFLQKRIVFGGGGAIERLVFLVRAARQRRPTI